MIDFVAKLISGDGITTILMAAGIYILVLWLMFSFWVFIDAKKRYRKTSIAVLFFFVVFIFNFPALIFYLVTRPEDENDYVVFPADNLSNRGINIPVVNFVGKDGKVNFSFELKINNPETVQPSDMVVDVNWKSESKNFIKVDEQPEVKPEEVTKREDKATKKNKKVKEEKSLNKAKEVNKTEGNKSKEAKKFINPKYKEKAVNSFNSVKTKVTSFKPKFNLPKKK